MGLWEGLGVGAAGCTVRQGRSLLCARGSVRVGGTAPPPSPVHSSLPTPAQPLPSEERETADSGGTKQTLRWLEFWHKTFISIFSCSEFI